MIVKNIESRLIDSVKDYSEQLEQSKLNIHEMNLTISSKLIHRLSFNIDDMSMYCLDLEKEITIKQQLLISGEQKIELSNDPNFLILVLVYP
jgi:hypothetical protein